MLTHPVQPKQFGVKAVLLLIRTIYHAIRSSIRPWRSNTSQLLGEGSCQEPAPSSWHVAVQPQRMSEALEAPSAVGAYACAASGVLSPPSFSWCPHLCQEAELSWHTKTGKSLFGGSENTASGLWKVSLYKTWDQEKCSKFLYILTRYFLKWTNMSLPGLLVGWGFVFLLRVFFPSSEIQGSWIKNCSRTNAELTRVTTIQAG